MNEKHTKNLIIGGGVSGYTAAIYSARACLNPILITGPLIGGQLTTTSVVENFPGFKSISGVDLMEKMLEQVTNLNVEIIEDTVLEIDVNSTPFKLELKFNDPLFADTIIIATGTKAKKLIVKGEAEFSNRGVSSCATCDGFFYRNKTVAVVGGGNTAVGDAIYLSNQAKKVILIHRGEELRAEKILIEQLFKIKNIHIIWNSVVNEIIGDSIVNSINVLNLKKNESKIIFVDGVFVAIGHLPQSNFVKGKVLMNEAGVIKVDESTKTSVPGIFAAGDVATEKHRQAISAAGMGCVASIEALSFLNSKPF